MTNANPPSFSSWQDGNLDYNLDDRTCQPTQVRIPQNTPEVKVAKVTYGPEGYDGNKCLVSGTGGSGPLDRKALAMIMMDGDDVPEIQCPCGSGPCIVLTSGTKKNPNRRFYKCPAENKCNFFKWCDELGQNSQSPLKPNQQWTRSPGKIIKSQSTPLGNKGRQGPICSCKAGLCVVRTMNEGENKGRKYYACSIKKGHGACNHFKWVDDPVKPPEPENNLNGNQNNLLIADVTTPDPKQTRSPYESVKDLFGENDMRTIEFWNKDQNDPNSAAGTIENEIRRELFPGKRPYQPSTIGEISPMKRLNLDDASPVLEYCRNCLAIGQCTDCPILACFKDGDFAEDKHENVMDGGNNNSYSADISPIGGTLVKNISPSPSTGGLKRSGKCFNCGKEGHWSNECTSRRTNSKCFKCGKVGHWMKNCNM